MQSKLEKSISWLKAPPSFMQCIHCGQSLNIDGQSLVCPLRHRFDLNKQGTIFMASKSVDDHYDRLLFEARRRFITASPFYREMQQAIVALINEDQQLPSSLVLVDAGSGEGSHLSIIMSHLMETRPELSIKGVGIDLAKEGVKLASTYNGQLFNIVADLAHIPIKDRSVDYMLSILSPSNYTEFNRLLKSGGSLIKVIPGRYYLHEIRQALVTLGEQVSLTHDPMDTIEAFKANYPDMIIRDIHDTVHLTPTQIEDLVKMTPLTWHLTKEKREKLISQLAQRPSFDLNMMILKGTKK